MWPVFAEIIAAASGYETPTALICREWRTRIACGAGPVGLAAEAGAGQAGEGGGPGDGLEPG